MPHLIFALLLFAVWTGLGYALLYQYSAVLLRGILRYALLVWYQDADLRASLVAQLLSSSRTASMELLIKEHLSEIIGRILQQKMAVWSNFIPKNWKEEAAQAAVRHLQERYPYAFGVLGARFPESAVRNLTQNLWQTMLQRRRLILLAWSSGAAALLTTLVLILQWIGNLISK